MQGKLVWFVLVEFEVIVFSHLTPGSSGFIVGSERGILDLPLTFL